MAGTWLAVVKGFGGMRVSTDGQLVLNPYCPDNWQSLAFKIRSAGGPGRGALLQITTSQTSVTVQNFSTQSITLLLHGEPVTVERESRKTVAVAVADGVGKLPT